MTILVVDDQAEDLKSTADLVRTLQPDEELLCFDNGFAALAEARNKEIDLAFLDAESADQPHLCDGTPGIFL